MRVFATDLDPEAVAFARRGVYPAAALAGVPPELVRRYFTQAATDGTYEITKDVRALTVFGHHDLAQRAPFPRIDLVLCRNVLIYFTAAVQRRTLQLFAFALREGGVLVLGKAETTSPLAEYFAPLQPRLKVYRRQGARLLLPPLGQTGALPRIIPLQASTAVPPPTSTPTPRARPASAAPGRREQALARLQTEALRVRGVGERLAEARLQGLPVGVVVVNRRYDIQFINGTARQLLGIHGTAVGEDVVHLAQGVPSPPFRAAIDAALRGDPHATVEEVAAADLTSGEVQYLTIACLAEPPLAAADAGAAGGAARPDGHPDAAATVEMVVLLVTDTTAAVRARQALEETVARLQAEGAHQATMLEQLTTANRQLLGANTDLVRANAALRAENDELLVRYEELQAATEEIETLNEEAQATNEELETLNEETQATNEELQTTNDDLTARGQELQELAATLAEQQRRSETERVRLAAILAGMSDGVLALDAAGVPVVTNAAYDDMFGPGAGAVVLDDEHEQPLPVEATPQARAARGEVFTMAFSQQRVEGERRWFEAVGRPVRGDGEGQGAVVVIREVTERSLRRLQERFVAMTSHELRTPLTTLLGSLQMVLRALPPVGEGDGRVWEFSTRALTEVRRMAGLVSDLTDVARLQSGKLHLTLTDVDLVPLVAHTVAVAQGLAADQRVTVATPTTPVVVQADAGRLEQVLLNLLTNAMTHAPGSEQIAVRLRQTDTAVEVEVEDHGPGILATDLPHLFSRFYQVTGTDTLVKRGLGLGLFISQEIVHAHGGSITVASTVGVGTTFTMRLPLPTAPAAAGASLEAAPDEREHMSPSPSAR